MIPYLFFCFNGFFWGKFAKRFSRRVYYQMEKRRVFAPFYHSYNITHKKCLYARLYIQAIFLIYPEKVQEQNHEQ